MPEARDVISLEIRARRPSTPNIDGLTDAILAALSSAGIDCEGWRTIESAPKDGEAILLARFVKGSDIPVWTCQAEWGVVTTGHIQRASYSGWFPSLPFVEQDGSFGRQGIRSCAVIFEGDQPPTHWRPLPLPPLASGGG